MSTSGRPVAHTSDSLRMMSLPGAATPPVTAALAALMAVENLPSDCRETRQPCWREAGTARPEAAKRSTASQRAESRTRSDTAASSPRLHTPAHVVQADLGRVHVDERDTRVILVAGVLAVLLVVCRRGSADAARRTPAHHAPNHALSALLQCFLTAPRSVLILARPLTLAHDWPSLPTYEMLTSGWLSRSSTLPLSVLV